MLGEKGRKARHHEQAREGEGTAEAQAARQRRSGAARGEFCLVGFLDGPFGAVIEVPTASVGVRRCVERNNNRTPSQPSSCAIVFETAG